MPTPPNSTLHGWQPSIGQLVWQTIYAPHTPAWNSTIEERIQHGHTYRQPTLMRVHGITPNYRRENQTVPTPPVTRWYLRHPGAKLGSDPFNCEGLFPRNVEGPSWVESDWAVLEDASDQDDQEALF